MHHAGLLALPPGARLREEHRHAPSAEDWVELLDDYVTHSRRSRTPRWRRSGARCPPSATGSPGAASGPRSRPVDRVLARSAAKTYATVEIAAAEAASLGERLRALVLCDHERAGARLPARLHGVLDAEAGSAWLIARQPRRRRAHPRAGPDARHRQDGRRRTGDGACLHRVDRAVRPDDHRGRRAERHRRPLVVAHLGRPGHARSSRRATAGSSSAPARCSARAGTPAASTR